MEIIERLKEIIKQETNTDIDIRTRNRQTVEIRSLYCTILKQLNPKETLQAIGDTIDLNHATVIHSLKNYKIYEQYNPELKDFKRNVLSYFTTDETETKEATEIEALQTQINILKFNNNELKNEIKKHQQTKTYNYEIIENLNNLLQETKGTMQHTLIQDRLEAFYKMNKNIRL